MKLPKFYFYKGDAYMKYVDHMKTTYFCRPNNGSPEWQSCSEYEYEQAAYYGKPCSEKFLKRQLKIKQANITMRKLIESWKDKPVRSKEMAG